MLTASAANGLSTHDGNFWLVLVLECVMEIHKVGFNLL